MAETETGWAQCRQIVRAGHRCSRVAKRAGFCDAHWRMRYGHQFDMDTFICMRCNLSFRGSGNTCMMNPYLDQPPAVYPEPLAQPGEES